jgi:NDP-sugar pyrophosphorylase family protein
MIFTSGTEPWTALAGISSAVEHVVRNRPGFYTEHRPGIYVGPETTIADSARIEGPAVIGAGCEIRHGAFLRNDVIVGNDCVIGNSTELKNCVLFDGVQAAHFNYIGDSVLGYKAHLGAGVILSNVRLDGAFVTIVDRDERAGETTESSRIATGLPKFGALIGDGTEVGSNSVFNPGAVVGRGAVIYPLALVSGVVREGTVLTGRR